MTVWQKKRRSAREAGWEDAELGNYRYDHFAKQGSDVGSAYIDGRNERLGEMAAAQARWDNPLLKISLQAANLVSATDSSEVRELAEMIEQLADYLLEKESGQ